MDLITCPDCGFRCSPVAQECLGCGRPLDEPIKRKMGVRWTPEMIARELVALQRRAPEGAFYVRSSDDIKEFERNFKIEKLESFSFTDPELLDEIRNRTAYTASMLIVLDPDNKKVDIYRVSSSSCFIATAVYGSPLAPELIVFRRFRDEVLLTSKLGAVFVGIYYWASPPFARLISKTRFLKIIVRYLLLEPVMRLLKYIFRS